MLEHTEEEWDRGTEDYVEFFRWHKPFRLAERGGADG